VPPPPPGQQRTQSATFSPTFDAPSEAGVDAEVFPPEGTGVESLGTALSTTLPPMVELQPLDLENGPSEEDIVKMLRTTENDAATFRQISNYFTPPPGTEYVRRLIEMRPQMFSVNIDKVSLRDPHKKEALNRLVRELVRAPLTKRLIKADEAREPVSCAARLALQACPQDVAKILMNVSKNTLRKTGKVRKGTYPANMPLVIACLVDCIVTHERKTGVSKRFENTLSPLIYQVIFQRWVLGSLPGSQFLANLLVTWERSGYFQAKHIEECKKPLWLLVAYAKADGVSDSPDKEKTAGWYKIVKREPGFTAGAEAICPRHTAEQQVERESVVMGSGASGMAPSEVSSTAPTEAPAKEAKAPVVVPSATPSLVSLGPTVVMGPPSTATVRKYPLDVVSVAATTETQATAPPAAAAAASLADAVSAATTDTHVIGPAAAAAARGPAPDSVSVASMETQVMGPTAAAAARGPVPDSASMASTETHAIEPTAAAVVQRPAPDSVSVASTETKAVAAPPPPIEVEAAKDTPARTAEEAAKAEASEENGKVEGQAEEPPAKKSRTEEPGGPDVPKPE